MASGHILQLGRSTSLQHVDALDTQLMVASKNCEELSSGRRPAFKLQIALITSDEVKREDHDLARTGL
jgi:hypothetical protein